jgi:hypothetical protein
MNKEVYNSDLFISNKMETSNKSLSSQIERTSYVSPYKLDKTYRNLAQYLSRFGLEEHLEEIIGNLYYKINYYIYIMYIYSNFIYY